jgi:fructose-1,6-bisphosphatase II
MAVDPTINVDIMMGTGGTPEGVLSACAIRAMGGQILAKLDPQSAPEKQSLLDLGYALGEILTVETLVRSENVFFAATGISGGTFLGGVRYTGLGSITHSLVMRGKTGTVRRVESHHKWDRLMRFSAIKYD